MSKSTRTKTDPYEEWPYASGYLLDTLDPRLIESHAKHLLCRSLNIGRTVAFLGAGVSMAYGRVSWQGLVDAQVNRVLEQHQNTFPQVRKQGHVKRLLSVLNTLRQDGAVDVKADRYPMLFQLCQQLSDAIKREEERLNAGGGGPGAPPRRPGEAGGGVKSDLHQQAMDLTIDDCGQAEMIVTQALQLAELLKGDGRRAFPNSASVAAYLDRRKLNGLRALASDHPLFRPVSDPLLALIHRRLDASQTPDDEDRPVRPTRRYLFGAVIGLIDVSGRGKGKLLKLLPEADATPRPEVHRQDLTPPDRDPLLLLLERLQITRYVTTNYDHEIERLLADRRYRTDRESIRGPAPGALMRPRQEVIVFDKTKIGELLAFATRDRGRAGSVVHLHGRAEKPGEGGEIVVTETDYQARYLTPDRNRDLSDAAVALTFGANPVVFIGSNMGEDDLLRPLRQFMSAPSKVGDRVAVALVPALGDRRQRTEDKIAHLGRYGVYTIHFGMASLHGVWDDFKETARYEVEWLPWVWSIKKLLEAIFADISRQGIGKWATLSQDIAKIDLIIKSGPQWADDRIDRAGSIYQRFAPTRFAEQDDVTKDWRMTSPAYVEGIKLTPERGLDFVFDVDVINAALSAARQLSAIHPSKPQDVRRVAEAYRTALEGAGNSILSLLTSARLLRARWEWDEWKKDWFKPPRARIPIFTRHEMQPGHMALEFRHRIGRQDTPSLHREGGVFYDGSPAQSFKTLLDSLRADEAKVFVERSGRRTLLLAGRRGVGKGHFFNVVESYQPLAANAQSSQLQTLLEALGGEPKFKGAAFYNLAFAHEVMSVFDGLSHFLSSYDVWGNRELSSIGEAFGGRRVERLQAVLEYWQQLGTENPASPRCLMAINALDSLFDLQGEAKNGQVKRLFDLLMSPDYQDAPIDFLLVCRDKRLPRQLLLGAAHDGPTLLSRQSPNPEERAAQVEQFDRIGAIPRAAGVGAIRETDPSIAVHVLHATRASTYVAAYHPRVALLLARQRLGGQDSSASVSAVAAQAWLITALSEDADLAMRKVVSAYLVAHGPNGLPESAIAPKVLLPAATVLTWRLLDLIAIEHFKAHPRAKAGPAVSAEWLLAQVLTALSAAAHPSQVDPEARARVDAELLHRAFATLTVSPSVHQALTQEADVLGRVIFAYDHDCAELHDALGGGRMLLTILLASASELVSRLDGDRVGPSVLEETARDVDRYLERARWSLRPVSSRARPEVLIDYVMAAYRRHHEQQKLLRVGAGPAEPSSPEQLDLMLEVLWHLAVIGQPVESDILAWCPRVRKAVLAELSRRQAALEPLKGRAKRSAWRPSDAEIEQEVECAIALALSRALIFRLTSEGAVLTASGARERQRYAVHRLIQRSVFEKMSSGSSEFTDFDQFTLTLYATQPDEMPKLTASAHREISALIESLSGYPGDEGDASRFEDADRPGSPPRRARLLRAALGVMRSVYSMAVLARFTTPEESASGARREGYFEEHRRRVRWLIKAACTLDTEHDAEVAAARPSVDLGKPVGLEGADVPEAPFYSEEIVWLYNECAVLSLVQGRLHDAQALLEAAFMAAKKIEPNDEGALHIRLRLNKAVVDIERGHGEEARVYLEDISKMTGEHKVPPLIACGYLGLIAHLAGENAQAIARYKSAVDGLSEIRRSRAASIFSRHYGDLLRVAAGHSRDESRALLESAIHLADEGGHEDVRAHAVLSMVKLDLGVKDAEQRASLHGHLDSVEQYARVVGMPRLTCEVDVLRARLLLKQGETRLAASFVAQALETASINDMRLLKIRALIVLAMVAKARGEMAIARPVERTVERFARSANQFAALAAAQTRPTPAA